MPAISRRLILALLLSLLVHLWMIGGLDGWLPDGDALETKVIRVELLPPPVPKPVVQPVPNQAKIKPKPVPAKPLPKPEPIAEAKPESPPAEPNAQTQVPTVGDAGASQQVVAIPDPEPVVESPPTEAASAPVEEPVPQAPGKVVIDYQIVRKGGVAGLEHQIYLAREDGSYTLTSVAEAKGLLSLVLSDLVQRSEGMVTPHGLRPTRFVYQYGNNADKAQKATFDWPNKTLVMEVGSSRQAEELNEGTQDLMSFMYQFMFVPPLQDMRLIVTNGKKLKVYSYGFEGEETLTTQMGPLRTLRIGKSGSDGEERTEIWLAADYHYLPVKISKTEKDGTVTERIATHLQTE